MKKLLSFITVLISAAAFGADGGYLFVTFKGEKTPLEEQVYFAISSNGLSWAALNDSNPVLVTDVGEKGARDSYILRSHDGKKFYVLATDLSSYFNRDWGRAVRAGSRSILIWESSDLVTWSRPLLAAVAADDAGCTWAPEAVYDEETGDYLVFWASKNRFDNFAKQRIWACRTRDFKTFDKPFIYIDKPWHVIDTTIVRDSGTYYRFSKDEQFKSITLETSKKLSGPWQDMPQFSLARMQGYEGPSCFLLKPATPGRQSTWCLLLDYYSKGRGYQPYVSTNLAEGKFEPLADCHFPFQFRHGSVLAITEAELKRLETAYSKTEDKKAAGS